MHAHYDDVLADIHARDERDSTREVAPLRPAPDAILLDTSELDVDGGDRRRDPAGRGVPRSGLTPPRGIPTTLIQS